MKNLILASSGVAVLSVGMLSAVPPAQAVGLYGSYVYKSGGSTSFNATQVGTINGSAGTFTPFTNPVSAVLGDIAVTTDAQNNDVLYGINSTASNYTLYRIASNGTGTTVNTTPINLSEQISSLAFTPNGTLYGAGKNGGLYTFNTTTGASTQVATIPNFQSSGDIVYDAGSNLFYATDQFGSGTSSTTADDLYSFAPNGSNVRRIGSTGVTGAQITAITIENRQLIGYAGNGNNTSPNKNRYVLSTTTGQGTLANTITGGAAGGYFSGTANDPNATVPFGFSPGLGILGLGAWGAIAQLKSKLRKRKSSESVFSNS